MDVDKSLNEALNIEPENTEDEVEIFDVEPVPTQNVSVTNIDKSEDIEDDYELARKTLHVAISAGSEALEGILDLAENSDSARAYEVAATTMKNLAETTEKLLELQKKFKEVKKEDGESSPRLPAGGGNTTNNVIFAGNTAELQKMLNDMSK